MNNKLKLWTITDGSQGMISQVTGLAQHLTINFVEKKIQLKWPWSRLQPGILPPIKFMFKQYLSEKNLPDIVVTCGRKSIYASLYLKNILKEKLISIHIQNPKIDCKNFDFIISPSHDKIYGKNIINSVGALHHLTYSKINNAKKLFETPNNKKIVMVLLGGNNNHYNFDNSVFNNLLKSIENLVSNEKEYFFIFIPSRRTNKKIIKLIIKKLNKQFYIWDMKSENPYLYCLKIADFIIVTSDSTSMISEACFTGKPVFIFHLPFKRKSLRFENFHREFEEIGLTMPFKQELYTWNYKPLNESKRIAGIINTRILKQNNE